MVTLKVRLCIAIWKSAPNGSTLDPLIFNGESMTVDRVRNQKSPTKNSIQIISNRGFN